MVTVRGFVSLAERIGACGLVGVAALIVALAAHPALAGEPGFYSGGKFHPLIVSPDELAVELPQDAALRAAAVQQARTSGAGVLEE
ncbi:MAG TPA: hypothetical protein P5572_02275, partial [Phycisphaerae bacterium]|nr:hypothetical protein [Phycisphaerae bacterium]